jgi:hypothetical protein
MTHVKVLCGFPRPWSPDDDNRVCATKPAGHRCDRALGHPGGHECECGQYWHREPTE